MARAPSNEPGAMHSSCMEQQHISERPSAHTNHGNENKSTADLVPELIRRQMGGQSAEGCLRRCVKAGAREEDEARRTTAPTSRIRPTIDGIASAIYIARDVKVPRPARVYACSVNGTCSYLQGVMMLIGYTFI